MKLRLRGNSLRLRISQTETRRLADGESVRERVVFGRGSAFTYALVPGEGFSARFVGETIEVRLPTALARAWAEDVNQTSLAHDEPIGGSEVLSILVEKDFHCRTPRIRPEDESDLFPHPSGIGGPCGVT